MRKTIYFKQMLAVAIFLFATSAQAQGLKDLLNKENIHPLSSHKPPAPVLSCGELILQLHPPHLSFFSPKCPRQAVKCFFSRFCKDYCIMFSPSCQREHPVTSHKFLRFITLHRPLPLNFSPSHQGHTHKNHNLKGQKYQIARKAPLLSPPKDQIPNVSTECAH